MADTYHEFDPQAIQHALDAAKAHNEHLGFTGANANMSLAAGGEFSISAQCISVTTADHKICLNLPLHIGRVCLPLPVSVPNGTAAQACLSICTTFGIPTGVKVTVSVAGHIVITKSFGKC
jgi:hypothetical protein